MYYTGVLSPGTISLHLKEIWSSKILKRCVLSDTNIFFLNDYVYF